ncbi:MBOAT family O-acyltransferase [Leptolyngbya sp. 7M]|uniref:MBOAT family O-acyltransferase n=1 Tax=Leptolyngbya sp. 7M TaxID=2812896 RepID=UPI001B8B9289|nr:MBOAT family O-acyltransferase [Leptolyngbya sp. 7M]QYO64212.1 hypothetical protein JVX88_31485 [Leptolyngbya sp. 7M]
MLFNSYIFILGFLPITTVVFFYLTRRYSPQIAKIWLTLASLFFYGYWNIAYLPLLVLSILFNYYLGKYIGHAKPQSRHAKALLWLGIGCNLGLIAYYKYAGFFAASVSGLFNLNLVIPIIILPLGISFYTFTQIAYLVDCYRQETKDYDFLTYILFISFFPQLIAGPLLLHSELIPQLEDAKTYTLSFKNLSMGLTWFFLGLAKKLLIADAVAPWANAAFENAANAGFFQAWVSALSYTLQLLQPVQRFSPEAAIDQIIPFWNQVVDRATAGHAAD